MPRNGTGAEKDRKKTRNDIVFINRVGYNP